MLQASQEIEPDVSQTRKTSGTLFYYASIEVILHYLKSNILQAKAAK